MGQVEMPLGLFLADQKIQQIVVGEIEQQTESIMVRHGETTVPPTEEMIEKQVVFKQTPAGTPAKATQNILGREPRLRMRSSEGIRSHQGHGVEGVSGAGARWGLGSG